jgi:8-oxo-dGTP diphosphatase
MSLNSNNPYYKTIKYVPQNEDERLFLDEYDSSRYDKPSVTADIVVFTIDENNNLCVLLIKRGGYPYKDKWAIPGGFVGINESVDDAARRELNEETNILNLPLEQFGTFGDYDRDPRMRVISVAYMSFVRKNSLVAKAGDDAQEVQIFRIEQKENGLSFIRDDEILNEDDLAFDHAKVIGTAIQRIRNRIDYTNDAFKLLKNDQSFTIYEVKKIFETIKCVTLDTANFRRDFIRKYVDTNIVSETNQTSTENSKRAAMVYCYNKSGKEDETKYYS